MARNAGVVLGLCLWAGAAGATANYGNRNLGVSLGAYRLQNDSVAVDWALYLSLEGGFYIDDGFEFYGRVGFSAGPERTSGATVIPAFGILGQAGVRYLFSQESLRPWAGLHLAGAGFFKTANTLDSSQVLAGGPGVNLGLDYFAGESIAIGARVFLDLLFNVLRFAVAPTWGGGLTATAYF